MNTIVTGHQHILDSLLQKAPAQLNFPYPSLLHMETEFLEWNSEENTLIARFPNKEEFQNPRQFMQGGFVVAALDNTLGPLAYLAGIASVTTQLNTSFARPAAAKYPHIDVRAMITDRTQSTLYSSAEALSPDGRILATVQASSFILQAETSTGPAT